MKRSILITFILAMFGAQFSTYGQNVTYGFLQNPSNPLQITAVAYPDFNSSDVDISTAVFSFLLPAGTITNPAIINQPGAFNNINGNWGVQFLTSTMTAANLEGNDVYQVVLSSVLSLTDVQSGVPIELFSFALPSDCTGGNVEVLTNDGTIRNSIFNNEFSNFNNNFDASINDVMAADIYSANNPSTFSLPCPLNDTPTAINDIASTLAQTPVNIPVLNNDDFGNNGPGTGAILITDFPGGGIATVNTNNTPNDPTDDTIDYIPSTGFTGVDVLIYRICDADGDCDIAEVSITVLGNTPPPVDLPAIPTPYKILLGMLLLGLGTLAASRVMS